MLQSSRGKAKVGKISYQLITRSITFQPCRCTVQLQMVAEVSAILALKSPQTSLVTQKGKVQLLTLFGSCIHLAQHNLTQYLCLGQQRIHLWIHLINHEINLCLLGPLRFVWEIVISHDFVDK